MDKGYTLEEIKEMIRGLKDNQILKIDLSKTGMILQDEDKEVVIYE